MNIERTPYYGGEIYHCTECGKELEHNMYPPSMVGTSARKAWEKDQAEAENQGVKFSGFTPCNC